MKFVFSADQSLLREFLDKAEEEIRAAKEAAVQEAAAEAVREGRSMIAGAGLPGRWQSGFKSIFYPNKETGNPAAIIYHRDARIKVFERGVTISGRPLLWLPIKKNLPSGVKSPKKYPGKLVSVNVAGKPPMLFDARDRTKGPLFFGTPTARIPKRLNLASIYARVAERMREAYESRFRG